MITVVGLGVEEGDLTKKGEEAILAAVAEGKPVLARTAFTRSYKNLENLGVTPIALDSVYEKSRSFKTLNKNLAEAVLNAGDGAVYCVDGSAAEDNSVKILKKRLKKNLSVVGGVSKITYLVEKAGFAECSYTAVSAYELFERAANGGLKLPLLVYDIDDRALASDVKLALDELVGDETRAVLLDLDYRKKIPLYELDRKKSYGYMTAVALGELPLEEKKRFTLEDLENIIVRLRRPDGCPWDKVQTPETIKMNAVEEAYELLDAIDSGDPAKIMEETGDVMLQAVFHAVMQKERGEFTLTDVLSELCGKLIFRHTHIFGKDKATDEQSALSVWEKNKMKEKRQATFADAVNDVPKAFPAAMRAQKIGKRAAKAGMDFASVEDAVTRLREELDEFLSAYRSGDKTAIGAELGDVLFAAVNAGRLAGADAEQSLKESADKFARRFTLAEQLAMQDGKTVTELSESEWDGYYIAAKKALKGV